MVRMLLVFGLLLFPSIASAHPGEVDAMGCHHGPDGYHCHRGPLAGQTFKTKDDAVKALAAIKQAPPKPQ